MKTRLWTFNIIEVYKPTNYAGVRLPASLLDKSYKMYTSKVSFSEVC